MSGWKQISNKVIFISLFHNSMMICNCTLRQSLGKTIWLRTSKKIVFLKLKSRNFYSKIKFLHSLASRPQVCRLLIARAMWKLASNSQIMVLNPYWHTIHSEKKKQKKWFRTQVKEYKSNMTQIWAVALTVYFSALSPWFAIMK